ncbi:VOC family protein [Arthrobacter sp. A5]|uniref:VOC family protein n=1 Tax=Arthrobacter sp. A5 TaxID=576926 RepID=UPI003DA9419F
MSAHELDHLAIAVPAWPVAGSVLNRELGARWASGFTMPVFNPCQLAVADDMRLELLEPGGAEHSFIQRFLDGNEGRATPHHITFKVHDIRAAITGAQAAGIEPILVNLNHRQWQEAFLHPKDTGLGFLAQMVQAPESIEEMTLGAPNATGECPWEQLDIEPVRLQAIHGLVPDLQRARQVLVSILGAREFRIGQTPTTLGFHWNNGADLLLTEARPDSASIGIQSLGILPSTETWAPGEYPADLLTQLQAGAKHPGIGVRISALRASPVGART